ncbi:hypothetical protein BRADI_2g27778v3 [Brachypodium distachyon]|uniref:Uncharacterized protein n=1 Tax=Brachypodium distachyon TaxID=15368 RepID=A0A2K2DAZ3_BRADI|nr:hypothetical protein BRADI_2g27778v3 [Brachypodium distachyon]
MGNRGGSQRNQWTRPHRYIPAPVISPRPKDSLNVKPANSRTECIDTNGKYQHPSSQVCDGRNLLERPS